MVAFDEDTNSYGPRFPVLSDHLESDVGVALAYLASSVPYRQYLRNSPFSNERYISLYKAIQGLFHGGSNLVLLYHLPPDCGNSYVYIVNVLGSAPPSVWSNLVRRQSWFTRLSPRHLDDWPEHINLRAYLELINSARHVESYSAISSVFQNPIDFLTFIRPVFEKLGWYDVSTRRIPTIHKSVAPLFVGFPAVYDIDVLEADSPPLDEDVVWKPAVYPKEWPPLPAPTWKAAWFDYQCSYRDSVGHKGVRSEGSPSATGERRFRSGIGKLVRQKFWGDALVDESTTMV
ncbi:hypothetical protein CYLTODRAFT_426603 [Cylindrobasidium torrendii FP15055 ss-10]|uniref:Uncharacterized protein n=1 Tax=Cylindrobasidium torrendii FP15055 ss-10 TaxID=1314674 RepID=A0A0D7AWV0_9AGAR|nr:hypothetical protein CYLTODRAFT_426603 [Cylindrobasidium torrendii FP15055 ss-10]